MEYKFNKRQTNNNLKVKIREHIIPKVLNFKYLISIIQSNGEIDGDLIHRIQVGWMKWRNVLGVICNRKIPNKLKGKFYRTIIKPAMLYGSECWALKGQHEQKIGVTEMRMLR